jgi:hypothetical protein
MSKVLIAVQMPVDASIGPNIGRFEGSAQEDTGEGEVGLPVLLARPPRCRSRPSICLDEEIQTLIDRRAMRRRGIVRGVGDVRD